MTKAIFRSSFLGLFFCCFCFSADWLTDGHDVQRSGWQPDEHVLTKDNVKNLKILWKINTGNEARALHALMPVLVVGQQQTANGPKQIALVSGVSNNLYAIDVAEGKIIWQKHFTYPPLSTHRRSRACGATARLRSAIFWNQAEAPTCLSSVRPTQTANARCI